MRVFRFGNLRSASDTIGNRKPALWGAHTAHTVNPRAHADAIPAHQHAPYASAAATLLPTGVPSPVHASQPGAAA